MSMLQRLIQQAKNPRGTIGSSMLCIMNAAHTRLTNWALQKIHIREDEITLDIGCGGGKTIHTLSRRIPFGKIYGIDYSEQAVESSKKANMKDVKTGKVIIQQASVSSIPHNTNFFDLITAFQTHYFWPHVDQDIKEVFRTLKTDGSFLLVAETFKIQYHMKKFKTTEEIVNLLYKTGFTSVKCYEERGCLCVIGIK
ncbi:TPA: class I SAM-dependent methyltransferase [Bacillus cereus]|uniref:class I SAM-dependent methyltransferase n=1 Tax=Bacillus TaxID=1386 RepID=UPI0008642BA2|nr:MULTISPECIES: class I SAM-dependent methyltransferase [Bacillus]MCP1178162.1 class I SAM-dependent methyltransferase [Bacillus sp. 1663tsa1]MCP1282505.1 class I SAM-dependent methyltransferase [Bacillus sp. S0635]MCQ6346809.1 class I SAM-dependent methyltransferase [Bacillus cereus]MCU5749974.1 class I SAM-dependent methyltransferase [Bacillus cereus]SCM92756.1 SAM-dependent methyltransferase [Bacillus cereus]